MEGQYTNKVIDTTKKKDVIFLRSTRISYFCTQELPSNYQLTY